MKKHQTTLSDEIERKIVRMFALGMSCKDISQETFLRSLGSALAARRHTPPDTRRWAFSAVTRPPPYAGS
ncbi:hypothetical protein D3C81_483140 [compost metagenome]